MKEQADLHIGCAEVIEDLLAVCVDQSDGSFCLHDDSSLDQPVSAKVPYYNAVVPDVDCDLDLHCEPDLAEFVREGTPIHGFEKAKSELVVNTKERPNDRARYFALGKGICVHHGSYLCPSALPLWAPARESGTGALCVRNRLHAPRTEYTH